MGEYGLDKDGSLWLEQFKERLNRYIGDLLI